MKPTLGLIIAALFVASSASAQTMYRCQDAGKTVYSDKPCFSGDEIKQLSPNGNLTPEYLARARMKQRADEQREMNAARAAKRETSTAQAPACVKGAASVACKP